MREIVQKYRINGETFVIAQYDGDYYRVSQSYHSRPAKTTYLEMGGSNDFETQAGCWYAILNYLNEPTPKKRRRA